jgi:hypothetical protein
MGDRTYVSVVASNVLVRLAAAVAAAASCCVGVIVLFGMLVADSLALAPRTDFCCSRFERIPEAHAQGGYLVLDQQAIDEQRAYVVVVVFRWSDNDNHGRKMIDCWSTMREQLLIWHGVCALFVHQCPLGSRQATWSSHHARWQHYSYCSSCTYCGAAFVHRTHRRWLVLCTHLPLESRQQRRSCRASVERHHLCSCRSSQHVVPQEALQPDFGCVVLYTTLLIERPDTDHFSISR